MPFSEPLPGVHLPDAMPYDVTPRPITTLPFRMDTPPEFRHPLVLRSTLGRSLVTVDEVVPTHLIFLHT